MIKKLVVWFIVFFSVNAFAVPVNVNTADAKTIADSLSGIGLKKAEAIVDYRAKNGVFKSIEDLNQVSGIGSKTIEKNKADILLGDSSIPPTASEPATIGTADKKDK
ncbi:MAG: helix-hairpin-helix domain-containing protein [Methylococcales bacterium]|nr:helix-hairpin-helix domain-containing protein [Methylococcales bacterium]